MKPGTYVNRRRSRSRARNRDVWTRIPQWISLPSARKSNITESEQESNSCQLCEGPTLASRISQNPSNDSESTAGFGPPSRARPRSRSVNRARFRRPLPVDDFDEPTKIPQIRTFKSVQKHQSNIRHHAESSGSSSEPEPINSPSLSRVSSTLSSDSVAELFPFDSEIFMEIPQNHKGKPNDRVRTEKGSEAEKKKDGVVAVRNPNTVAICAPPRMITGLPSKIALGIPSMRGSFGACISTTPPELSDVVEKLRSVAGIVKHSTDDASNLKTDNSNSKAVVVQNAVAKSPTYSSHNYSAESALPNTSNDSSYKLIPTTSTSKQKFEEVIHPMEKTGNATEYSPLAVAARSLKFCCQLAHGSPTAIISNFTSVDELFQSIADCFNISADDIIFCTINTFKPDMDKLFAGNLEYSDMLFAHIKGQAVEVELTKTEGVFGLTVSDNGRCRSFIKRMKENSIVSRARPALAVGQLIECIDGINVSARARPALAVGQLIECIDGINVSGMRHFEVVRILRNMPIGKTFVLRVVSPKQSGFQQIAPRSMNLRNKNINDGMRTLRFKANGGVVIEEGVVDKEMITRLNEILDSYLGVQDDQMAQSLLELALSCETLPDMNKAVRESELSVFEFPDELVFDMWGVIGDSRRKHNADNKHKVDKKSKGKMNLLEDDEEKPLMPLFS
ncbi:hypothetical protein DICVIV_09291 [Dictyocaulus viviparus]|uniref:PDZ domain-containing protein n=1 Tax=Dictyocaulus viviparus TaxID=29172 RepID=A0A0D8XLN5_DICVI|nr:hypothetical protein DICVIV_09291 [Dictyocaulus viviparus]